MQPGDLWVFGYGSLIWQPGFGFTERRVARLTGYRRGFCMSSVRYRGTPEAPGLVLALDLDPAASCTGVAYRVAAAEVETTLDYLRTRELINYAYKEVRVPVVLDDGRAVEAVAFVMDRSHPQYCGGLSLEQQADVIARAEGPMGPNADYLMRTVQSLETLGLHDPELARLVDLVRARL